MELAPRPASRPRRLTWRASQSHKGRGVTSPRLSTDAYFELKELEEEGWVPNWRVCESGSEVNWLSALGLVRANKSKGSVKTRR